MPGLGWLAGLAGPAPVDDDSGMLSATIWLASGTRNRRSFFAKGGKRKIARSLISVRGLPRRTEHNRQIRRTECVLQGCLRTMRITRMLENKERVQTRGTS
jgi:hypothetical protein